MLAEVPSHSSLCPRRRWTLPAPAGVRALATCGVLSLSSLLALPSSARAQTPVPGFDTPSPTRGLYLPGGAIAGDVDGTSAALNPGQIGFVDGSASALVFNHWKNGVAHEGRGLGFFLAQPLVSRSLGIATSFEWLRPTHGGLDAYGKLSLGVGSRLGRALSMGVTWDRLMYSRAGSIGSWSFGLGLRPHDVLAAGFVLRDAFRPRLAEAAGGTRLPREFDSELALRPTGTGTLELAGGVRALSTPADTRWLPHARAQVRIARGLALFADAELARGRLTTPGSNESVASDYRFGAGLAISFDRTSLSGAALGGYNDEPDGAAGAGAGQPGFNVAMRFFANRRAALISGASVARVKLKGLESDRSYLAALLAMRRLAEDRKVAAVLLNLEDLDLGYGRTEELRAVLEELARRKPLFTWLTQPGTAEYYLASASHKLVIHPAGNLTLSGIAQNVTFWKGAMDKLGVAVDLVRIAEYKGAMEPFVMTEQSGPVRDNRIAMLDDLYGRLKAGITRSRGAVGVDDKAFSAAVDQALFSAPAAKDRGLVDAIADEREMEDFVHKTLGRKLAIRDADLGGFEAVRWQPKRVAVILVDGAIADGKPTGFSPNTAGIAWADPIVDALAAVRRDPSVRAVVLRVNSPGGSAFASDRIAREVKRLRESKKPIVVSMGDAAASGGYYIAAPADMILASPSSITGSIGIFAYKADVSGLAGRLGLNNETVTRGKKAALYSPWKPWNEEERTAILERLEQSYQQFLRVVADGRKSRGIDEKRAGQLGRGRVYTGAQAQTEALVDRLGGFTDALAEASQRGNVPRGASGTPELVVLPRPTIDPLATLLALRGLAQADAAGDGSDKGDGASSGDDGDGHPGGGRDASVGGGLGDGRAATPPSPLDLAISVLPREIRNLVPTSLASPTLNIEARLPYEITFR